MTKVILWTNKNKTFKLSNRHIQWLNEHGVNNQPQYCGDCYNFDSEFTESIESLRAEIVQVLQKELSLCVDYQQKQEQFLRLQNNFEIYVVHFWINLLELNPHMIGSPKLDALYSAIMHLFLQDDFKKICNELSLNVTDEMQSKFDALINRRIVVKQSMEKRDDSHEAYRKFCADVGMRMFSHIPPVDGFEIVEYDETKYHAKVKVNRDMAGYQWEELILTRLN